MRRAVVALLAVVVGCVMGFLVESKPATVHGQAKSMSIAAVEIPNH